ncbi:MAG: LamG-like jellyroll fold domain-containing protein [Verrucomicrobiota bacterium]
MFRLDMNGLFRGLSRLLFFGIIAFASAPSFAVASLIAHYGFEETTLTNGSTISDTLGNNNGAIEGAGAGSLTSVSSGVFGNALNLGPAGYVDLGTGVQLTDDFTISFWIQNLVGTGNEGILGSANGIANGNSGFILKPQNSGRLFFDSTIDGNVTTENNLFLDLATDITDLTSVWNFVSIRFDSDPGTVQFTISGTLADPLSLAVGDLATAQNTNPSANSDAFWDPNGFAIGARNGAGLNEASFTIDDLRFYDTVLTDAELITVGTTPIPEPSVAIFALIGAIGLIAYKLARKQTAKS